ncbi:uncharacterized protein LOC121834496 [Ixodes scapularis]|uniref:uncharacterized protein LOC121834496 n=1 Tax=Ixodes scapularis TaxID=6945 RepID=UPI001C39414C|nr:uncharacterized protein LOC121834496 [Ixodes scapularis]
MLSASWKATTDGIIQNCFRKARFETPPASTASALGEGCGSAPTSTREVLDAMDVLRRYTASHGQQDAVQALWALERCMTPRLLSNKARAKLTDYFAPK